jgi:hypothetical protein
MRVLEIIDPIIIYKSCVLMYSISIDFEFLYNQLLGITFCSSIIAIAFESLIFLRFLILYKRSPFISHRLYFVEILRL